MIVAYSTQPIPAPPYSSGKITPSSPSSASFGINSIGKCCSSSHSNTCGPISDSANSRTLNFTCRCSSVNSKCISLRPFSPVLLRRLHQARGFRGRQQTVVSGLQALVRQIPDPHPPQLQHRMTDQLKHPAHLLVASLVQ